MTAVRRPKPRKTITTLRELVLDLAERLEGGNATSDVWLPYEEWNRLAEAAELDDVAARLEAQEQAEPGVEEEDGREAVLSAALDGWRSKLAQALGAGVDTEFPDLVEIARGYAMALDAERQAVLDRAEKVVAEARAKKSRRPAGTGPADVYAKCESCGEVTDGHVTSSCPKAKAGEVPGRLRCPRCLGPCLNEGGRCVRSAGATRLKELRQLTPEHRSDLAIDHPEWFCERGRARGCALQADHAGDCMMFSELEAFEGPEEPEAEHPECPHCGEADGHKPNECAMNVDSDAALAADSGRRLNGAGWKRSAKEAREKNALDACHHCGVGEDFGDELLSVRSDEVLPDGVFCRGCRVRLAKNPAEWERHGPPAPTMVEKLEADEKEAAAAKARPKKRRATKKFPLGGDPLELCTQCGASYGDHAGTRCPKKQRRMKFVDGDAAAASPEAPF